jgi:RNA polymerase sigma-70 factor (sigma-E family)
VRDANREEHFSAWAAAATPQLLRVARLLTADVHAGEDLLQDVLAKMYLGWSRIEDPGAYARRALTNAATSRWRRAERRSEVSWDLHHDQAHHGAVEPSRPLAGVELRMDLLSALRGLPSRQRAVVVLRYLEERTEREVADLLDISVGTVKSQTSRALNQLREQQALPQGTADPLPPGDLSPPRPTAPALPSTSAPTSPLVHPAKSRQS